MSLRSPMMAMSENDNKIHRLDNKITGIISMPPYIIPVVLTEWFHFGYSLCTISKSILYCTQIE